MSEFQNAGDIALATLLSVGREVTPELPEALLRRVFALQVVHQFDADRAASLLELQRAVQDFIGQRSGDGVEA